MNIITLSKGNKLTKRDILEISVIFIASAIILALLYKMCPWVYADATESMVEAVLKVLKIICGVVGALFLVVGIVKFAISHANEDGPAQQKAIMMMATGVLLIALIAVLTALKSSIVSWIQEGQK